MPVPRDDLGRNLDAQSRRLEEVEQAIKDLEGGADVDYRAPFDGQARDYQQTTEDNKRLSISRQWTDRELEDALTSELRQRLEDWRAADRIPWRAGDYVMVGLVGLLGALASFYDDQVDAMVRSRLAMLKSTDLVSGWEADARNLPIDYTGPNFGGPGHRLRSAGHDVARPFAALQQIRDGYFKGTYWVDGVKKTFVTPPGSYMPIEDLATALTVWVKHLLADVVTPMSLPLPGFSLLYELDDRSLRKFAHALYDGPKGPDGRVQFGSGLNMRSGLMSPLLSVLLVEVLVRVYVHLDVYRQDRRLRLTRAERAKTRELLAVSMASVGAASLGKAFLMMHVEGPVALRHVNAPALMRCGVASAGVLADRRHRNQLRPPEWEDLLKGELIPWELPEALSLEELAATAATPKRPSP